MRSKHLATLLPAVLCHAFLSAPIARAAAVDPSAIFFVTTHVKNEKGKEASQTVACMQSEPGTIKDSHGALNFDSLAAQVMKARKKKAAATHLAYLKRLQKAGAALCTSGTQNGTPGITVSSVSAASNTTSSITGIGELGAPLAGSLSSLGSQRINAAASLGTVLQSAFPCASLTSNSGSFTLDFGAGCSNSGITLSGAVTFSLALQSGSLAVTTSFNNLDANGHVINGSGSFALALSGVTETVNLQVTDGQTTHSIDFTGTAASDSGGIVVNGSGHIDDSTTAFTAANLHKSPDHSCYPDGGTLTVSRPGQPAVTVTFSSATPATGAVQVQVGDLPETTENLPACD